MLAKKSKQKQRKDMNCYKFMLLMSAVYVLHGGREINIPKFIETAFQFYKMNNVLDMFQAIEFEEQKEGIRSSSLMDGIKSLQLFGIACLKMEESINKDKLIICLNKKQAKEILKRERVSEDLKRAFQHLTQQLLNA